MVVALEPVAGMALTAALGAGTMVLVALGLGRMATMDEEQREVEPVVDSRRLDRAA
jgi:hypothetical protein